MAVQNTGVDAVQFKLNIASGAGTEPKARLGTGVRVRLTRETGVAFRYLVSDELRDVLPGLAVEPREEDVFQAFWAFLEINDLLDLRFRRLKKVGGNDLCVSFSCIWNVFLVGVLVECVWFHGVHSHFFTHQRTLSF